MPFGVMVGPIVISWFVASWFLFDKNKFINGFKNPWFLLMFAFILMHTISGFLSHNKHEGLSNIEVKLSFLAFPYFFFLFGVDTSIVKRMVVAFVSGCFFALMACLFRATYIYFNSGENEFFYSLFSFLIHAGYFSMYMLFCILILVFVYPLWFKGDKWLNMIRYFFIISFLIGIFLCASKMGYITAVIVLLLVPFIKFRERLNFKNVSVSIISLIVVITVLLKVFPKPFERINNALTAVSTTSIDKTSGESTAVRLLIWDASMEIIKENVLLGVGTGDANDILQERYKEKGLTGALEHNLNAHDQFFQTAIALGIPGTIVLLLLTLGVFFYAIVKQQPILALFSLIIILNFLVESMLQTQAGNLFFVGFLCLLLTDDILKLSSKDRHDLESQKH
jgi:O-antigen ligase